LNSASARRCASSVLILNIGTPLSDGGGLSIRPPGIAADQGQRLSQAGPSATYHVSRSPKYGYDRANNKASWMSAMSALPQLLPN
jgi:hypothetical protein